MNPFEGSFRNLNFSSSTSILLILFFPFIDITCFFLKFKTSVLSNNRFAKLFKETSYSKATMVMQFPAKTNVGCPKAPRDFPQEKMAFSTLPVGLSWDSPPLRLPQSLYGRTYADVTTKISRIDRLPNLLSNGARWRALPTGSAIKRWSSDSNSSSFCITSTMQGRFSLGKFAHYCN